MTITTANMVNMSEEAAAHPELYAKFVRKELREEDGSKVATWDRAKEIGLPVAKPKPAAKKATKKVAKKTAKKK